MALLAAGKWSVKKPPPFSLSNIPVNPHSSPGRGPRLQISTMRRSPGIAGSPDVSVTRIGPLRLCTCQSSSKWLILWNSLNCSASKPSHMVIWYIDTLFECFVLFAGLLELHPRTSISGTTTPRQTNSMIDTKSR